MQKFQVKGMSCGHCVRAVTQAVQALDAAAEVQVDLPCGEVKVVSQLPAEQVMAAIREEGYEVAPA
ncbi:heavy-metal-associated domain-containing protein [Azotobacter salinestris]|uniref:heavy-metal-associated domain-containing protein n=1 Tax=Azotobacter salinestris TaxID=69964 RepID=UPI0012668F37|nr:cation transporter [Azotobacter salinestris]